MARAAGLAMIAGGLGLAVWITGCPPQVTETTCTTRSDCPSGQNCVNEKCVASTGDAAVTAACYSDEQCRRINPNMFCNSSGLCDFQGTTGCTVTTDCPDDQFCNFQSQVCIELQPGFCRNSTQCGGKKCSATAGGVGRCVDCMANADCDGGACNSNGTCGASGCVPACQSGYTCNINQCVPIAGDCNPPCVSGENCQQGVCYGANGCPRHAHPVNNQCACDDGYQPNAAGNGCVSTTGECDAQQAAVCTQQGGQWDNTNCVCLSGGNCSPPCSVGTVCQGTTCVPVTGSCDPADPTGCMLTSPTMFFTCDATSNTCVCDALTGFIACWVNDMDFDEAACDCDWSSVQTDAGTPYDAGRPDTAQHDARQPDSSGHDARRPDAATADAGGTQAQPGQVGAPCTDSAQCTELSGARCYTDWPGGYCDKVCDWDNYEDCGTNAYCACEDLGMFRCRAASCYHLCESVADCRSGYSCIDAPNDEGIKVCGSSGN